MNEALCSQYTAGSFGPDTGRCNCSPAPSLPVGTGAVQVSLTWYVNDINGTDMDLHLVEPGGFEIYYNATSSPNGGILDYDDTCGDFRQGTTENIYYASDPPSGEYIVSVHYYGDYCGGSHPTQSFAVRTIVQGITQTFNRSLAPGEEIEITRFSISGSGPARFLPPHDGIVIRTDLPAK